jgi:hypothetical protein
VLLFDGEELTVSKVGASGVNDEKTRAALLAIDQNRSNFTDQTEQVRTTCSLRGPEEDGMGGARVGPAQDKLWQTAALRPPGPGKRTDVSVHGGR